MKDGQAELVLSAGWLHNKMIICIKSPPYC